MSPDEPGRDETEAAFVADLKAHAEDFIANGSPCTCVVVRLDGELRRVIGPGCPVHDAALSTLEKIRRT